MCRMLEQVVSEHYHIMSNLFMKSQYENLHAVLLPKKVVALCPFLFFHTHLTWLIPTQLNILTPREDSLPSYKFKITSIQVFCMP